MYEQFTKTLHVAKTLHDLFWELLPLYIGKPHQEIGTKIKPEDGTPVTDLDNHSLALIREVIEKHFPGERVIGEEDTRSPEEIQKILVSYDEFQWTADGLDGTGNLRAGLTSYGVAVSRRRGNEILFSADFRPFDAQCKGNGFLWAAEGAGAWEWCKEHDEFHKIHVAPAGKLERLVVLLEGSSKKFFKPPITYLGQAETTRCSFSSCVASAAVARGQASALVTVENKPWDNWPSIGIIEGAGGIVTDWQGNPRRLDDCGNMVAEGNKVDHARIIELLNQKGE